MSEHPELVERLKRHSVRTDKPFTLRSGGKAAERLSLVGIEFVALCTLEDLGL